MLVSPSAGIPPEVDATECWLDLRIGDGKEKARTIRFIVGDQKFVDDNATDDSYGYIRTGSRPKTLQRGFVVELRKAVRAPARFAESTWPRLVLMPSDDRDLVVPKVKYKAPGVLQDTLGFIAAWERTGPQQWAGSIVELLFSARWADLNAKEEGHPHDATNFDSYARAFADLMGGTKKLAWTRKGDLVVELEGGTVHDLSELSSGERQALVLLAELRRRWKPGSLVLIDELELHLHDAWQGKMLDILTAMQKRLGGQVVITTQSHSLFEMAALGTRALLGRGPLK